MTYRPPLYLTAAQDAESRLCGRACTRCSEVGITAWRVTLVGSKTIGGTAIGSYLWCELHGCILFEDTRVAG